MRIQKIRFEPFGGIVGTTEPAALFWVDREYLRARGFDGRERWPNQEAWAAPPQALPLWRQATRPVEAELAITSRCNLNCPCCYQEAGPGGEDVPYPQLLARLRAVATLDVFHVAFGGGEPLLHPQLFALAEEARRLGLIPSLSTNGSLVTPAWARAAAPLFGRVNVSLDLPGGPRQGGSVGGTSPLRALAVLAEAGATAGANFIVTRPHLGRLPEVFRLCREAGADSVLLLRFKPGGRGSRLYSELTLTPAQGRALVPLLLEVSDRYRLPFHLDCALGPLLMRTAPLDLLARWGAAGCIAGTLLLTVDRAGYVHPCSHLAARVCRVSRLPEGWLRSRTVDRFRLRPQGLQGECGRCGRRVICGGGCAAVNRFRRLPLTAPDPDLPCGSVRSEGKDYGEDGAAADRAFHGDFAPVQSHQPIGDGQAQAGAAGAPGAGGVDPVKALEDEG